MPEDENLALVDRECRERFPQIVQRPLSSGVSAALVTAPDLLHGDHPLSTQMIECEIASDPQDPGDEGNLPLLVFSDDVDQLGEDLLGDVFRLMGILDDAAHVSVDVVGVAHVEEPERLAIALLGASDRIGNPCADQVLGVRVRDSNCHRLRDHDS